jgi:hypothetical protein
MNQSSYRISPPPAIQDRTRLNPDPRSWHKKQTRREGERQREGDREEKGNRKRKRCGSIRLGSGLYSYSYFTVPQLSKIAAAFFPACIEILRGEVDFLLRILMPTRWWDSLSGVDTVESMKLD